MVTRHRHRKVNKLAAGTRNRGCFKVAVNQVKRKFRFAYYGRILKHRNNRRETVIRVGAVAKSFGTRYSLFRNVMKHLSNREILDWYKLDDKGFEEHYKSTKTALGK